MQRVNGASADNDTTEDQDIGLMEVFDRPVLWQIDYLQRGAPIEADDPSNNATTCRVITIMLADEP